MRDSTKFSITTLILASAVLLSPGVAAAVVVIDGDFNRPDSPSVGNGWQDLPAAATMEIKNNELTDTVKGAGRTGVYRPLSSFAELRVTAVLKEGGGDPSVRDGNRFEHGFRIHSDGTSWDSGYGVVFGRSDSLYTNSSQVPPRRRPSLSPPMPSCHIDEGAGGKIRPVRRSD